jgi:hypothetical protein
MTESPAPQPRSASLPPVLPRQQVLAPLPPRRHFYSGYGPWHWTALIVGLMMLVVAFGPTCLAILDLFQ